MTHNHWLVRPIPLHTHLKTTIVALLLLVEGGLFVAARQVSAAATGAVTATVTVQNISITVTSDGAVTYGTLAVSSTADTTSGGLNDSQTVQNNGNITEDFNILGQTSSPGSWTLAATAASEQYFHKFCVTTCDVTPSWTALSTDYQTLASDVAGTGTQVFDLQIGTPTATAEFDEQSVDITVQAVSAS